MFYIIYKRIYTLIIYYELPISHLMYTMIPTLCLNRIKLKMYAVFIKTNISHMSPYHSYTQTYARTCTVYSVQCTVYSVQCTVYWVHCTLCVFTNRNISNTPLCSHLHINKHNSRTNAQTY